MVVFCGTLALLLFVGGGANGLQFTDSQRGYTITYPNGWHVQRRAVEAGGALNLTTFQHWMHSGRMPPHGAQLVVQVPRRGTEDYAWLAMKESLAHGPGLTILSTTPDRVELLHTPYVDPQKEIWVASRKGDRLFLFILDYYADDPGGASYERVLDELAASLRVLSATPVPTRGRRSSSCCPDRRTARFQMIGARLEQASAHPLLS